VDVKEFTHKQNRKNGANLKSRIIIPPFYELPQKVYVNTVQFKNRFTVDLAMKKTKLLAEQTTLR
jgi:hypothetical protein